MPIYKNGQKITPKPRLRIRPTMGLGNILHALCLDPAPFAQNHGSAALLRRGLSVLFLTDIYIGKIISCLNIYIYMIYKTRISY